MSLRSRSLIVLSAVAAFLASAVVVLPQASAGDPPPLIRWVRSVDLSDAEGEAGDLAAIYEQRSEAANPPPAARGAVAPANGAATRPGEVSLESELRRREVERNAPGMALSNRAAILARGLPVADPIGVDDGGADSWHGLSVFDTRFANAGRAYALEPSDLALCVSDDYVLEAVNTAVQVYDAHTGEALLDGGYANPGRSRLGEHDYLPSLRHSGDEALDLNQFFGEAPAFDRDLYYDILYGFQDPADENDPNAGVDGNSLGDPVCRYDAVEDRWIVASYILYWDTSLNGGVGDYSGQASIAVAVSENWNPTGDWNVFEIDTTNNGEFGGPDHDCDGGYCFGDYPQIGLDANGVYFTTNEFSLFGADFNGAQLYAVNKHDLYAASEEDDLVRITYLDNVESVAFGMGVGSSYSLQPVDGLPGSLVPDTMYFGMSHAGGATPVESMSVFRLANTCKLNGSCLEDVGGPSTLSRADLSEVPVDVGTAYAGSLYGQQGPAGQTPFLDAYNAGLYGRYPRMQGPVPIDLGSDGKLYGAWIHDGTLLFSTVTGAFGSGSASFNAYSGEWRPVAQQGALALFAVPLDEEGGVSGTASDSAVVGVPAHNFAYPTVVVNASGEGAVGTTLMGADYWPSVAYLPLSISDGIFDLGGELLIAREGAGPNDGFTGVLPPGRRPRWGDYGGAATDGSTIWLSAGYIGQMCDFDEWYSGNYVGTNGHVVGTCGNTRTTFANWATGIVRYQP